MDGNISSWSTDDYDRDSIKLCVEKIKEEFGQQFSKVFDGFRPYSTAGGG